MAKNKKLSELTLEELYEAKKKQKKILTAIGITMLFLCGTLTFLAVRSKNYALLAVASGSFITLIPSFSYSGQIEKEIQSRNIK
ncbi:MAG: hypothetical protein EOO90_11985 [Pedobacter sp.]|nr:MAG: hypothetical protein EOO90_11985 [Pedobacter sp.]